MYIVYCNTYVTFCSDYHENDNVSSALMVMANMILISVQKFGRPNEVKNVNCPICFNDTGICLA